MRGKNRGMGLKTPIRVLSVVLYGVILLISLSFSASINGPMLGSECRVDWNCTMCTRNFCWFHLNLVGISKVPFSCLRMWEKPSYENLEWSFIENTEECKDHETRVPDQSWIPGVSNTNVVHPNYHQHTGNDTDDYEGSSRSWRIGNNTHPEFDDDIYTSKPAILIASEESFMFLIVIACVLPAIILGILIGFALIRRKRLQLAIRQGIANDIEMSDFPPQVSGEGCGDDSTTVMSTIAL